MFDYAKGLFEGIYPGETVPAGAYGVVLFVWFCP